jgi:hypothetical protein
MYGGIEFVHALIVLRLPREFDDEDAFFAASRDQHDQADLGQDVVVLPAQAHARQRSKHTHRNDEDHGERKRQRFILRRQHHEDAQHRDCEDQRRRIARRLLLEGETGPFEAEPGGRFCAGQFLHGPQGLPRRDARWRLALQLRGRIIVVARHLHRTAAVPEGRDRGERHHLTRRRAYLKRPTSARSSRAPASAER